MKFNTKILDSIHKGTFSARDALEAGLTYYELRKLVEQGLLRKEGRGVFVKTESAEAYSESGHYAVALAQVGEPSALCLWSALVFHDLTEEAPAEIWVYLPYEKTTKLKIKAVRKRQPFWNIGIEVYDGVRVTNIERTLVDVMADRRHFSEPQAYKMAVNAIRMKKTSFKKLYDMARRLKLEKRLERNLILLEEAYVQR